MLEYRPMRGFAILFFLLNGFAVASEPDVLPRIENPVRVPAAPLSPEEEARREALARYGLGFLRTRDDRWVDALGQYRKAIRNDPDAIEPQRELVKLYAALGRDAAAIRTAREVIAKDPDDFDTAGRLGQMLTDGKKYPEAVAAFRLAVKSKKLAAEPNTKFTLLGDLNTAAEKANDFPAREFAARERLNLLAANKNEWTKNGSFTLAEFDRRRAKIHEDLGSAFVGQKKFDSASAAFETARDLFAGDPSGVARLHWNLSGSLLAQGEPAKALAELNRFLEKSPAGSAPYERWVQVMVQLGRAREIPGPLNRLASLNPTNPAPAWLSAAATLATDPNAGHAAFLKLLPHADKPDYFRILVAAYEAADQPKSFLEICDQLMTASRPKGYYEKRTEGQDTKNLPPASEADVRRAQLFTAAANSLRNFTKPLVRQLEADGRARTARTSDTLELVMTLAVRDGQIEPYAAALKTHIARKDNVDSLWLFVICLRHQKLWTEIATTADELSLFSNGRYWPAVAIQAATAHAELGREAQALAIVEKLEGRIYIRIKKAEVFNILGKHREALREVEDILAKDKPRGDDLRMTQLALINCWQLLNETAKAEKLQRELLDENPDDVLILNNLGYHLAEKGRKLDEAETMLRRAVELDRDARLKAGDPDPESGNHLDSLGWLLFKRGKYTEARETLERAARFSEVIGNGVLWDHLGDVNLKLNDKSAAAKAYEKAVRYYTDSHEGRHGGRREEAERKLKLCR